MHFFESGHARLATKKIRPRVGSPYQIERLGRPGRQEPPLIGRLPFPRRHQLTWGIGVQGTSELAYWEAPPLLRRIQGLSPACMIRAVSRSFQTHMRSPFLTAAP
jgi:hypothetical protein